MTIKRALAFLAVASAIAAGCTGPAMAQSLHPPGNRRELR
jgi:hypothetical protein